MANATGNATLNFGSAPGSSSTTVVVTGQASISSASNVEAFLMGTDSTATHNGYEHSMVPMTIRCQDLVAGTGFTITAFSEYRLTGTFKVRWVWAD